MKHRPFVFLDIETTGGSAETSRITEIGALRVEEGRVVGTFRQLVNPEVPVPYFITRLTGISNDMVWQAPAFRAIASDLEVFLDGALFIAHNVNFDYSFIRKEFSRVNHDFKMDRLCSARLSRSLYPEHRSHALDRLIERLNLTVENRHRAYDDAEVIWKFFQQETSQRETELYRHIHRCTIYR
jgi:DNA polymerase-3 subunit epsilon